MLFKISVHRNTVGSCTEMNPVRFYIEHLVTLLEEYDIRGHFRTGIIFESVVRETYCSDKLCSLCEIFSEIRICLVKRSL